MEMQALMIMIGQWIWRYGNNEFLYPMNSLYLLQRIVQIISRLIGLSVGSGFMEVPMKSKLE